MVRAPSSLRFVQGDATAPPAVGAKIICHICNDVGAWGKGLSLPSHGAGPSPNDRLRNGIAPGKPTAVVSVACSLSLSKMKRGSPI